MTTEIYLFLVLIYLLGLIVTTRLLKTGGFGYAPFAAPFMVYPFLALVAWISIKFLGAEIEFLEALPFLFGGLFVFSISSLAVVMFADHKEGFYKIRVVGINSECDQLNIYDQFARPTGKKLQASDLKNEK